MGQLSGLLRGGNIPAILDIGRALGLFPNASGEYPELSFTLLDMSENMLDMAR